MEKNKKKVIAELAMLSLVWIVAIFIALIALIFMYKGLWTGALIIIACEAAWILGTRWVYKKNI